MVVIERYIGLISMILFLHISCKSPQSLESWSDESGSLRFRIYTGKSTYQEGEEIWLYVDFENSSKNPVVILVDDNSSNGLLPLYDLEKLIFSKMDNNGSASIIEIIPSHSNLYNPVPALFKLNPKQVYSERSNLNGELWIEKTAFEQKGEHINLFLKQGKYTLQAIYHWEKLPYNTPETQQQLANMNAPLWTGYLESNK
jgi:hypothetical protein